MRLSFAMGLLIFVAACRVGGPDDPDDVRSIIVEHNENLEEWYAEGDIDAVASVFAEDAWQMPPNSEPLIGREAIRDYWSEAMEWGAWEFSLDTQEVVTSGAIAVERGSYELGFEAGEQAPPWISSFEDRGNYVVLWRRSDDGAWHIVWDAPVSTLPPPSAPPAESRQ